MSRSAHLGQGLMWGLLVGALVAVPWALLLLPLNTAELARADELGLASFTVVAGYPESQELPVYLWYVLAAPAIVGVLAARRRREDLARPSSDRARPWWENAVAAALIAIVVLDLGYVIESIGWGRFGFLAEEGVYLGTAAGLRAGGALYRDLAFSYGPLMAWPVPVALRLAGDDLIGYRVLVWAFNVLGLALGWMVLKKLVRRPAVALAGLAGLGLLAVPVLPNLNAVTLRLALGAVAAVLAACGASQGKAGARLQLGGGVAAGAALGFSFEVGVAAVVAAGIGCLLPWINRGGYSRSLHAAARVGVGMTAVLVPLTLALALRGELVAFVTTFGQMVTLPGAGYQALPWPDLLGWFRDASGQHRPFPPVALTYSAPGDSLHAGERLAITWWACVPWVVLGSGVAVSIAAVLRSRRERVMGSRTAGLVALVIFGIIVGRGAVGRSDLYHLQFYGALPASLVAASLVDRILARTRRWPAHLAAAGLMLALVVSVASWPPRYYATGARRPLASHIGVLDADLTPLDRPRSRHVRLAPDLAAEVRTVIDWSASLDEQRTVWFYPSEASYYWLTGRAPITPYPWAYDAATRQQRIDLVEELQRTPPDCVLVTEGTFSIDHVPAAGLLPEIEQWLASEYVADLLSRRMSGVRVLRHKGLRVGDCGE